MALRMSSVIGQEHTVLKWTRKVQLIAGALLLLIVALGFNVLLSLNSLEKLYVESIASQYSAIGRDLQRTLETSLKFGKSIQKFVGIDNVLTDTQETLQNIYGTDAGAGSVNIAIIVSVALPDGMILYSTQPALINTPLLEEVRALTETYQSFGSSQAGYVKAGDQYTTTLPVQDGKKQWGATVVISFDASLVNALLDQVRNDNIIVITFILIGSTLLLILLFSVVPLEVKSKRTISKMRINLIMLIVIGSAQIIFSVINTSTFGQYYVALSKKKAETLTTILQKDIEFLFSKGIRIDKLVKMDVMLGEILSALPELSDMQILDTEKLPLYIATRAGVLDMQQATDEEFRQAYRDLPAQNPKYQLQIKLQKGDALQGYLSTQISWSVIFSQLLSVALDAATVLLISMLFFGELLILLFQFIDQSLATVESRSRVNYEVMRPAAFLFIFGSTVAISFIPLYMEALYMPLWNLSKDLILGLPISAKMLFTGIAIVIAGIWLDRRSWQEPFLGGLFLASCGWFYAWQAPNALHFIIAQSIIGFGYGLTLMSAQGFVIAHTSEQNKTQGLAHFWAGVYAGGICGIATGGMLAERLGYQMVFLFGGIMLLVVMGYTLLFMRNAWQKPSEHHANPVTQAHAPSVPAGSVWHFLFNKNVIGLIVLNSIPAALAVIGFLEYFSPIYLKGIGTAQSNIARIFMLNNLCIIYIAPFLSKYIDASPHKKWYVVCSGVLGSLALIGFSLVSGLATMALAVFCLGLSNSVGAARDSYLLMFPKTRTLGAGKAMSIMSSVERIGQVLGPIIFGWLVFVFGLRSILYFGSAYLILTSVFALVNASDKKLLLTENQS